MEFSLPHPEAIHFEIPDDEWAETGMNRFCPTSVAYRSHGTVTLIPLLDIRPITRATPFYPDRMQLILSGFSAGDALPPVEIITSNDPNSSYKFDLYDGFHRFYASAAAGYTHIPASVVRPLVDEDF